MNRAAAVLLLGNFGAGSLLAWTKPGASAQERAVERLEALGISPNGSGFVRVVAASHRPMIDLFFIAGVDVNVAGDRGRTPLLAAALARDWSSVARLLERGADVVKADDDGVTPLMAAAVGGRVELMQDLLTRGARAETPDRGGHTALHYAVAARQQGPVDFLLQTAIPSEAACCEGQTLATHALATRDPGIIRSVLSASPPIARWSGDACELLNGALRSENLMFAKILISKHTAQPVPGEKAQPYVAHAVVANDPALLRKLIDCGASPNVTLTAPLDEPFRKMISANFVRHYMEKEPGVTPLMIAAGLGRVDCVKVLLERGANRLQSTKGRTKLLPLYFAGWAECPEAIQLLVGGTPPTRAELRVEVDITRQRATVLQHEIPIFSTSISSGTSNKPTPIGEFVITDKDIDHRSSIYNRAPMPFFMRLSCRDFGLHQGYVTGRPASHGCIRLPAAAARKLYKELPIGTWVSVVR